MADTNKSTEQCLYECPDCKCQFVQPFKCTTCGAQKLYDHTVQSQAATIAVLRDALETFVNIAEEAFRNWDKDNDPRVGKLLLALSGHAPRYRADIDAIHALRARR